MIGITSSGDFGKTRSFLTKVRRAELFGDLNRYGRMGVEALSKATPVDTGLTANSWEYRIVKTSRGPSIEWYNTNGNVAILIQYGHGTRGGGYVQGRDYINPAVRPLFDKISQDVWKKVIS